MIQKAIVKQILDPDTVQISLMRQLECGLSCKSCDACPQKPADEVLATADNSRVHADTGNVVEVESNTAGVYLASLLVFILPCLGLILGYLLGMCVGFGAGVSVLCSFACSAVFCAPALIHNSAAKRRTKPEFTVIRVLR